MRKGFTLIELIIVIVLMGILSVLVTPRIFTSGYKEEADVVKFITAARFIQHESMIYGGGYYIEFESENRYCLKSSLGGEVDIPGENGSCTTVETRIYAESNGESLNKIIFDYMGRPQKSDGTLFDKNIVVHIDNKEVYITPVAGGVYEP